MPHERQWTPYGGAGYPIEAGLDPRIFASFHLDAGIPDVGIVDDVMQPLEVLECRDWLRCRDRKMSGPDDSAQILHSTVRVPSRKCVGVEFLNSSSSKSPGP